jgi:hypothetical protein
MLSIRTIRTKFAVALCMAACLMAAPAVSPAAQGTPAAHAAPALQAFEPDSLARIVARQQGKPFVLVLWSLDCVYCQASLKTLAEEIHKRKNLRVVTLSTDAAADPELAPMMRKRLAALGLSANAWAFGDAPPEQLRYMIDPKWHGEKPRSYWYDARGERVAYSGVITAATIERFASGW